MAVRKIKTSIGLDEALVRRLDRLAKLSGGNRSSVITDLIHAGLEQQEVMIKAATDPVLMRAIGKVITDPGVLRSMVAGMRNELSDEQLDLFASRVRDLDLVMSSAVLPSFADKPLKTPRKVGRK